MKLKARNRIEELLKRLIVFSLTSGVGTIVDLSLHWVLSAFLFKDSYWWPFLIAPSISFECAVFTNFNIAYFFVWHERLSYRGSRSFWRHYAAYNATATGVFCIKLLIMQGIHLLLLAFGWLQSSSFEPVLCNLMAQCFSGGFNFVMNEFVIFKKVKKKEDNP